MNYLYQLNKIVRLFKGKKKKKRACLFKLCIPKIVSILMNFVLNNLLSLPLFLFALSSLQTLTLFKCSQVSSIRNCKYINIIEQGCSCYVSSLSLAANVRCKILCKILLFYKRPAQYFNMLLEKQHDHQKEFILLWLVPMQ